MQPPHTWNYSRLAEAFQTQGLGVPKTNLVTLSLPLVIHFLNKGRFLTAYPRSVMIHCGMKVLPVKMPVRPWPVAVITLKNRILSPVVERFIECIREVAKSFAGRTKNGKSRSPS